MANPENLTPFKKGNCEDAVRKGGINSGIAKRKKKVMAEAYAEFLIKKHKIDINGEEQELSGWQLVDIAIKEGFNKNPTSMPVATGAMRR